MRLSDYRLKFAELVGPWTTDHPDKEKWNFDQTERTRPIQSHRLKEAIEQKNEFSFFSSITLQYYLV